MKAPGPTVGTADLRRLRGRTKAERKQNRLPEAERGVQSVAPAMTLARIEVFSTKLLALALKSPHE
jgi:hypothetical protein